MGFIPKTPKIFGMGTDVLSSSYVTKLFRKLLVKNFINQRRKRHFEIKEGNIVRKEGKTYTMISLLKKKEVHVKKEGSRYISLFLKKKVFFCLRRKNILS